ncbi:hypothetical protein V7x_00780 [Crateriforma conspicua]|uniref:Uncharacterized protein n=1 Tax=Crateriforma conspicua TaxID=2527996 RepID=A0A5C6FQI8_9PLAN|nr:hypothetical protein V7x_00780 [Crateriforma conspicua]
MGTVIIPPRDHVESWGISSTLAEYPDLRITPVPGVDAVCIQGELPVAAQKPGHPLVVDKFRIRIEVPFDFPRSPPLVFEVGGRVPKEFHQLENGALCLASPTRQLLHLHNRHTLLSFIHSFVVPYFYGVVLMERGMSLPFGELAHGRSGLLADFQQLFRTDNSEAAIAFVGLTARPKRKANHCMCPCGSGVRLSRCQVHHAHVIGLRKTLGRRWFKYQHEALTRGTAKQILR